MSVKDPNTIAEDLGCPGCGSTHTEVDGPFSKARRCMDCGKVYYPHKDISEGDWLKVDGMAQRYKVLAKGPCYWIPDPDSVETARVEEGEVVLQRFNSTRTEKLGKPFSSPLDHYQKVEGGSK